MSNVIAVPNKPRASRAQLDTQLNQAKSILRRLRQTVEDLEDARTIERAKAAHGKKPRIPWSRVKKRTGPGLTAATNPASINPPLNLSICGGDS